MGGIGHAHSWISLILHDLTESNSMPLTIFININLSGFPLLNNEIWVKTQRMICCFIAAKQGEV